LEEEAEKVKLDIQKIESQLADYKQQYSASLPELLPINMTSISRLENSLQQLQMQEKMLTERKISLRNQLTTTSPVLETPNNANTKVETRASLEIEYRELSGKYSETHPDVKALKRKLDGYKNKKGEDSNITNPTYMQLLSELNIADVELANINQQRVSLNEQLKKLELNVAQTHQVERGYDDMMRDLENHKAKYTELKAKYLEAKLSQNLEFEQKAEKFSLIEPPRVPERPEKPNRLKILFLGFVLSVGGGLGAGILAEMMDGSIRSYTTLTQLTGTEPLVVIPYILNEEDLARSRRNKLNFTILGLSLLIGATIAIHFLYMPIGMVFEKLSDRMSMLF
jgi:polysaccharide biosynthesis transport protein